MKLQPKSLYFEIHVTLDPIDESDTKRIELFHKLCKDFRFRPAELLMKKTGEKNPYDAFCTTRTRTFDDAADTVNNFVRALKAAKFVVRRYKIEDTVADSKVLDEMGLID